VAYGGIHQRTKDPSVIRKTLDFNLKILALSKEGKPETVEQMSDRLEQYFMLCRQEDLNPTVEGLALATDYALSSIRDIKNREYVSSLYGDCKKSPSFHTKLRCDFGTKWKDE